MTKSPPSSPAARRRGAQRPTRLVVPSFDISEWRECHDLNAVGGLDMLEWQDGIMEGWLGRDRYGRWAAPTCAGSIPRQNGKSLGLVESRSNYGMLAHGEKVLYTSHLQKTSTETFEDMANFFDSPKLRRYVKDIKTALGREQIILRNGGRIKFLARTRNGGRGQHGDLLIFDEALELNAESQASFLPAISASPNPQTIYVSTPPTAQSVGTVLRGIRDRALSGEAGSTAWFEWSVDEIGDVCDRDRWYATNPSLGVLIQESTVAGEVEQMDPDTFARERLGWWPPTVGKPQPALDVDAWRGLATDSPNPEPERISYGVRFSNDGQWVALSTAERTGDVTHLELLELRPMHEGLTWLVEWLSERSDVGSAAGIDGKAGTQALMERMSDAPRDYLMPIPAAQAGMPAAMLADSIADGSVTWFGKQEQVLESVETSTRRRIGHDGAWGFDGEHAVVIESLGIALWALRTARRDPSVRGGIYF